MLKTLFYTLVLLLPLQLGKHFFFDFSQVAGVRSDYLAPTIYLTDLLIIALVAIYLYHNFKAVKTGLKNNKLLLAVLIYLLFSIFIIAENKLPAVYKGFKILEFFLLGWVIIQIKPKIKTITLLLSLAALFSSALAITQFLLQHSIGGPFWYLGERTFYASTPAIATFSFGGKLLLRPYATFPHPNVLAGFLALIIPWLLYHLVLVNVFKKGSLRFLLSVSLVSAIIALILTWSRAAWVVALLGALLVLLTSPGILVKWLKKRKEAALIAFYLLLIISVITPSLFANIQLLSGTSIIERRDLINASLSMIADKPLFGFGLHNSLPNLYKYLPRVAGLYAFQPVHNMYLLVIIELGLVGFFLFLIFLISSYKKSLNSHFLVVISTTLLLILGLFDHYLLTLQQGQLLFVLFTSLAFLPKDS